MSLYLGVFSIILLLLIVHLPSVMARSFSARPDCDDKISSIELLAEHQVPSLCSCSALCHVECGCFGFNPQVSKCRIHWSCDVANMTSSEDGWRYYKIDRKYSFDLIWFTTEIIKWFSLGYKYINRLIKKLLLVRA